MSLTVAEHARDQVLVERLYHFLLLILAIFAVTLLVRLIFTLATQLSNSHPVSVCLDRHELVVAKGLYVLRMKLVKVPCAEVDLVLDAVLRGEGRVRKCAYLIFALDLLTSRDLACPGSRHRHFLLFRASSLVVLTPANVAMNELRQGRYPYLDSDLVKESDFFIREDGIGVTYIALHFVRLGDGV